MPWLKALARQAGFVQKQHTFPADSLALREGRDLGQGGREEGERQ